MPSVAWQIVEMSVDWRVPCVRLLRPSNRCDANTWQGASVLTRGRRHLYPIYVTFVYAPPALITGWRHPSRDGAIKCVVGTYIALLAQPVTQSHLVCTQSFWISIVCISSRIDWSISSETPRQASSPSVPKNPLHLARVARRRRRRSPLARDR